MALERLDHRLVGLLVDLRDDPAEVADRLVVVDGQRERDPRRPWRPVGLSRLRSRAGAGAGSRRPATPAAGRYSCSVYSWSIRVVENRQSVRRHRAAHPVDPARRQAVRVALVVARARSPPRGAGRGPARRAQSWAPSSGFVSRPPIAQPLSPSQPSSHQPSRTLTFDDAVHGRLHPARPGRLERPARVVEPDVDALDEEAGDPHVVVLEDEDPAAQLRRSATARRSPG